MLNIKSNTNRSIIIEFLISSSNVISFQCNSIGFDIMNRLQYVQGIEPFHKLA